MLADLKPALAEKNIRLHYIIRPYDSAAWPHATKGFFKLKQKIPQILTHLQIT